MFQAGREIDAGTARNIPEYVMELAAARRLGMSFVELVNSQDYDYLIGAAQVEAEFEAWVRERDKKRGRR